MMGYIVDVDPLRHGDRQQQVAAAQLDHARG